jgi:hypothetical protein
MDIFQQSQQVFVSKLKGITPEWKKLKRLALWGIKNNFLKVDDFKGIISLIYIIKIS